MVSVCVPCGEGVAARSTGFVLHGENRQVNRRAGHKAWTVMVVRGFCPSSPGPWFWRTLSAQILQSDPHLQPLSRKRERGSFECLRRGGG